MIAVVKYAIERLLYYPHMQKKPSLLLLGRLTLENATDTLSRNVNNRSKTEKSEDLTV
jgi:hypothetical protein